MRRGVSTLMLKCSSTSVPAASITFCKSSAEALGNLGFSRYDDSRCNGTVLDYGKRNKFGIREGGSRQHSGRNQERRSHTNHSSGRCQLHQDNLRREPVIDETHATRWRIEDEKRNSFNLHGLVRTPLKQTLDWLQRNVCEKAENSLLTGLSERQTWGESVRGQGCFQQQKTNC